MSCPQSVSLVSTRARRSGPGSRFAGSGRWLKRIGRARKMARSEASPVYSHGTDMGGQSRSRGGGAIH
eukprot:5606210-Prymnesium_polylepis.1